MTWITVGFSHDNKDWISRLIAWLIHGRWSHVVLVSPDGSEYIEASGIGKPGVRTKPLELFLAKDNRTLRRIYHPHPDQVWQIASTQLGKGYDWSFLWGWLFRLNMQDKQKWTCNELIAWAAAEAGHPLLVMDDSHYLTPDHLFLISQPME